MFALYDSLSLSQTMFSLATLSRFHSIPQLEMRACNVTAYFLSVQLLYNSMGQITRNSARLTDQRGSYTFSYSPFTIHVRHRCLLPTYTVHCV